MARLDVYGASGRAGRRYLVDVQSRLLSDLPTRAVVPLADIALSAAPVTLLNPVFDILGRPHSLLTQYLTHVPMKLLKRPVASLDAHYDEITRALDLLLTGF